MPSSTTPLAAADAGPGARRAAPDRDASAVRRAPRVRPVRRARGVRADAGPALVVDGPEADGVGGVRIRADNVSAAWTAAFDALMQPGVHALSPVVVSVTGFRDGVVLDTPEVERLVDAALREAHGARPRRAGAAVRPPLTAATVANTIFPSSLWFPGQDRRLLYDRYARILPRLKRDGRNRRGVYFERLVAYPRGPQEGNQLEHMIQAFARGVTRVSAFQATVCDPRTDLTAMPLQGFPCLQHVAAHPDRTAGTLALTGFYGTQYLFERGYGNYLGLARVGRFLAHEMGLRLTRVTCVASYAPMSGLSKDRGRALVRAARGALAAPAVEGASVCGAVNA